MMIGVDIKMTKFFFDKEAVVKDTERKERRALSKVGAFVRRRARTLIRSRKRNPRRGRKASLSRPGMPPISWAKPGIRDILFYYDAKAKSVVIGPLMFNGTDDVPGFLEFGGSKLITESRYTDRQMGWQPGAWKDGPVEQRTRRVTVAPRPFMGPALELERETIMDAFEA